MTTMASLTEVDFNLKLMDRDGNVQVTGRV